MKKKTRMHFYLASSLLIVFSCVNEIPEVPIDNLQLLSSSNIIEVGATDTLKLEIHPPTATSTNFTWVSSDPSIAEVGPDGVVRGISPGVANITVTASDNKFTANTTAHIVRWTYYPMQDVHVRPVFIDSQDNVWCGAGTEVTRFMGTNEFVYPDIYGISAIAGNNPVNIWFGTYGWGIWNFDGFNWTNYTSSNSNLVSNAIYYNSMAIDPEGNVWMGTVNERMGTGVTMFDGREWHIFNTDNGLASNNVNDIAFDQEGVKWFVTRNGVSTFDDFNWNSYTSENTGIDLIDNFFSMAIDKENNKWFGSYGGATKFDGTNWTIYNKANSDLKWNSINDITVDQEDNIWFATEEGVSKFDGNTWINYTSIKEKIYKVYNVRSIAIDSKGVKWLGTTYGVIKLED